MFDISWTEFLLIGVVALIVIGPKELPTVLRTLGQYTRKIRSMAAEFQGQFHEALREADMADLKKQVDDLREDFTSFDPLKREREHLESIGRDVSAPLETTAEVKPADEGSSTAATAELTPLPAAAELTASAAPELPEPPVGPAEVVTGEAAVAEAAVAEAAVAEAPAVEAAATHGDGAISAPSPEAAAPQVDTAITPAPAPAEAVPAGSEQS